MLHPRSPCFAPLTFATVTGFVGTSSAQTAPGPTPVAPPAQVQVAPPTVAVAPVLAPPPAPSTDTVVLELVGDDDAELEYRYGPPGAWVPACHAPCRFAVPVQAEYRVAGSGIRPSRAMTFARSPGSSIRLHVDTASKGAFVGGIVLTSVGAPVFLVAGLVTIALSSASGTKNVATAGAITGVAGVAAGSGIALMVLNSKSTASAEMVPLPSAVPTTSEAPAPAAYDPRLELPATDRTSWQGSPRIATPVTTTLFSVNF